MKTIISGSRNITDPDILERAIQKSGFTITEVIEGGQCTYSGSHIIGGLDWLARLWALRNNISVKTINADWDLYGKAAGPIRNTKMAEVGEQLIAVPDRESRGTRDMIKKAEARKLPVYIYEV